MDSRQQPAEGLLPAEGMIGLVSTPKLQLQWQLTRLGDKVETPIATHTARAEPSLPKGSARDGCLR